jgi:hypothetical protein
MATFTSFPDRLPDPTILTNDSGINDTAGTIGPGFASVTVRNNRPVQTSRTISGRGVQVTSGAQHWEIDINYHPMTRDQFDIVASFLDSKNGRLNPFYVVLPQNSKPKNANFAAFVLANTMLVKGAHAAGSPYITMDSAVNISGQARPGDFFTISDPLDINHKKAYKVVTVETNAFYQSGKTQPALNETRIWTMPPLTRFVSDNSTVIWINPKFRVIQKSEVLEYQLGTDNLYQFQLQLEEISA